MKVEEITGCLESLAPLSIQESYDNSGLQVGDPEMEVKGILISIDLTKEVLEEAVRTGCNLILTHHPLIFGGLKSLTGATGTERMVILAIKNDIAIYAGHTNFDAIDSGVNRYFAERLGLQNVRILRPSGEMLRKLVVFVPDDHVEKVRLAMFEAGAGTIGDYDSCSFNLKGEGTFRGSQESNPFVGKKGEVHFEPETRVEAIVPSTIINKVVREMIKVHPYEEAAFDIYPLQNTYNKVGMGMIGELPEPMGEINFLKLTAKEFNSRSIRHTRLLNRDIKKVAICGGSGSFLLKDAIAAGADVFVTGDVKYHQFFEAEDNIVIVDIGHYESEQFTRELFYELLTKKFPKFAIRLSEVYTNPIKYF